MLNQFIKLLNQQTHCNSSTDCIEYVSNQNHKTAAKTDIKNQKIKALELLFNIKMPKQKYMVKSICNHPNCINPQHLYFTNKEITSQIHSDVQKALWGDEEHAKDRIEKIKKCHNTDELKAIHKSVATSLHANNYSFLKSDGTTIEGVYKENVLNHLLEGSVFINKQALYLTNHQLKQNKKYFVKGTARYNDIINHLKNGWEIGYNGQYESKANSI